jgi:cell division protein FtsB
VSAAAFAQTREIDYQPVVPRRRQRRRLWSHVLLFAGSVLLVNGVFGERGLIETLRARRAYRSAAADLTRLRDENTTLRGRAERLRSDPATIESVAREELGLARPGEIVVTVHDVK